MPYRTQNRFGLRPSLAAAVLQQGVDYGAMDGQPSDLFFLIAAPADGELHLEILSRLMQLLMDPSFTQALQECGQRAGLLQIIDRFERKTFEEPEESASPEQPEESYRVLAVTACPTGIAHTYMAAQALGEGRSAAGHFAEGGNQRKRRCQNILTEDEIRSAEGIIVAADKQVETERFSGKPVLFVPVAEGIHRPEKLIRQILDKEVPVYHHAERSSEVAVGIERARRNPGRACCPNI